MRVEQKVGTLLPSGRFIIKNKYVLSNQVSLFSSKYKHNNLRVYIRVAKKVGGAVVRNLLKRRIRNLARLYFPKNHFLVSVRKNQSYLELRNMFSKLEL